MHQHTEDHGSLEVPIVADTGGASQSTIVAGVSSFYLQITGSFVATYKLQGSVDEGATWWDLTSLLVDTATGGFLTSPISAAGLYVLYTVRPTPRIRVFCASYTTGAPAGRYSFRAPS